MALGAALVDTGFLLRKEEASPKEVVEGTVIFTEPDEENPDGPEFRCRLDVSPVRQRTKDGLTQVDPRPRLLTGVRDKDGNLLEFRIGDEIKVVSRELGTMVWGIDDRPEPLRKRRSLIGWQLTLHRVEEG